MRTIFSGNKRTHTPAFANAIGDGRGHNYRYENFPDRRKRDELERDRGEYEKVLYRVNVWPKGHHITAYQTIMAQHRRRLAERQD